MAKSTARLAMKKVKITFSPLPHGVARVFVETINARSTNDGRHDLEKLAVILKETLLEGWEPYGYGMNMEDGLRIEVHMFKRLVES